MKLQQHARFTVAALQRQAGMTLMEIIAALAIIAAVVVGALALFNSAQSSNNVVTLLKDLTAIRSAAQQLYMGQGGYGTDSLIEQLHKAGKIPGDIPVNTSDYTAKTPLGGNIKITGETSQIEIEISEVPKDVCIQLVTNASSGWMSVEVNGATARTAFPVTLANATSDCNADRNTIVWLSLS